MKRTYPSDVLTPRRLEVLRFVRDFQAAVGWPPSIREIGDGLSMSSSSTPQSHVSLLVKHGYLARGGRDFNRTLRLTTSGLSALTAADGRPTE